MPCIFSILHCFMLKQSEDLLETNQLPTLLNMIHLTLYYLLMKTNGLYFFYPARTRKYLNLTNNLQCTTICCIFRYVANLDFWLNISLISAQCHEPCFFEGMVCAGYAWVHLNWYADKIYLYTVGCSLCTVFNVWHKLVLFCTRTFVFTIIGNVFVKWETLWL